MSRWQGDWVSKVFRELLLTDARRWVEQQFNERGGIDWKDLPPLYADAFESTDYVEAFRQSPREAE